MYLIGSGASPQGMLPFLDRQNLDTLQKERLWRCEPGAFERPIRVLGTDADGRANVLITQYETPTSPPNYRLRRLDGGPGRDLTDFPDPTPQLRGARQELVTYERADGVPLSATPTELAT